MNPISEDLSEWMRSLQDAKAKRDEWLKTPEGQEGLRREEEERRQREAGEAAAEAAKREARFATSGVPRRIRELLTDPAIRDTRAIERVVQWQEDRVDGSWCLVLSSDKGAGKSVAAGWWLRAQDAAAYKPKHDGDSYRRWWTGTELAVLDWYGGAAQAVSDMTGPLVIDDLGTEFNDAKGFFQQRLDALIDARYREYRPTLITTNLSAKDFAQRYGQRVVDRIREGGAFFEFNAKSMRGQP